MATQTNPGYPPEHDTAESAPSVDAKAKAQQAAGQAQEKAQAAAGQAQAKVRDQLDQRSSQLGEQAHQQASDLRSVGEALRNQGKDRPAQAVVRLAGYAEQAGSYLRDSDAESMLSDAEDLGRRKPAAVAAGALALGLVASRFLKASSTRRYSGRQTRQPSAVPRATTAGHEPPVSIEPAPVTPSQPPTPRSGI
jgi:uncharacterized protein with von Willebrand factor type A (vWA) domain